MTIGSVHARAVPHLPTAAPAPSAQDVPPEYPFRGVAAGIAAGAAVGAGAGVVAAKLLHLSPRAASLTGVAAGAAAATGLAFLGAHVEKKAISDPMAKADGWVEQRVRTGEEHVRVEERGPLGNVVRRRTETRSTYATEDRHASGSLDLTYRIGAAEPAASIADLEARFHGSEQPAPTGAAIVRHGDGYLVRRISLNGLDWYSGSTLTDVAPEVVATILLPGATRGGSVHFLDGRGFGVTGIATTASPSERADLQRLAVGVTNELPTRA